VETYIHKQIAKGPMCAALLDPEHFSVSKAATTAKVAERAGVKLVLIGGSTISDQVQLEKITLAVKRAVTCPVILFPGNITGVSRHADAIFFSSLLNSTNPYFIIGAQAIGAIQVYRSRLEAIPMAYLVFGNSSTTSFVGQVNGLPFSKPKLAIMYALAAGYLGMRVLYLEAGSGAQEPIPPETIAEVKKFYTGVIVVGGGITTRETAAKAAKAGAGILVVGNLLQKPDFEYNLKEIVNATLNG
jgi:phosphoglycerol geranylgeranyltransferase